MKFLNKALMTTFIFIPVICHSETIIKELPDTLPGKGYGGAIGMMAGSVASPIGAVFGAAVGSFIGGKFQEITGIAGRSYQVRDDKGIEKIVRSPNKVWQLGDSVKIVSGRLKPLIDDLSSDL